ncbi:nucleotidyltransferase family protein [Aerococcus sp. 1KP-2016]|uniref:tRNA(Met) cytidine acetate ligase n=1 Tax=Aerococcus sp. 1KP-2016 TaxID=1981982 RepID=UPI000B98DC02|nr:nucleotidyltransferase family protein [Aerococcus sp. 1KP-2016]OYQ66981.1 nucleotidyltransferase [Aerococcus sp. 1KP-2016]
MQAVGIIAEWHPFHHGHAYQLQQARVKSGADIVIGIMSGNYVQRGEPALISKWDRAQVALDNGCDLVVELPFWYATQPADIFASGGIQALSAMGCDFVSFGVEDPHFKDYEQLAQWMHDHPEAVTDANTIVDANDNMSFAEKRIAAIKLLMAQNDAISHLNIHFQDNANTLLAFAYAKANAQLDKPMQLVPVDRIGDNHRLESIDESSLTEQSHRFTSGSAIRRMIQTSDVLSEDFPVKLAAVVPEEMVATLVKASAHQAVVGWDQLYPFLKYRLMSASPKELAGIYQMSGGMEHRMQDAISRVVSFEDFVDNVRNRNWSRNRVQRTALMTVLNVLDAEMQVMLAPERPQPLMLLAANAVGRGYLKLMKEKLSHESNRWQLVSRVDQLVERMWPMWIQADRIYELLAPQLPSQNFNHPPIFK